MRFFSNEAKDNADERDPDARADQGDQTGHAQSEPVAVPQQRAGSPWQHGPADGADRTVVAEPAPQPTAFGASTVGGAVAASATAGPSESDTRATDRTTDAAAGVADDDRTVPPGDRPGTDTDRTDRADVTGTDRRVDAEDEAARSDSALHTAAHRLPPRR